MVDVGVEVLYGMLIYIIIHPYAHQGEYELNDQQSMVAHKLLQRVKTEDGVAQATRPPRGVAKVKKGLDRMWMKKATGRSRK